MEQTCERGDMAKAEKQPTTTITVRPLAPSTVTDSPRSRVLRARATGDTYTLIDGALDLGLVTGDEVSVATGSDGARYFSGVARLRPGILAEVLVYERLCSHHAAEFVDQVKDDWRIEGASSVHERGGRVRSFWPPTIPHEDVTMAVELSTSEYGLPFSLIPAQFRPRLIAHLVSFGPPPCIRSAA